MNVVAVLFERCCRTSADILCDCNDNAEFIFYCWFYFFFQYLNYCKWRLCLCLTCVCVCLNESGSDNIMIPAVICHPAELHLVLFFLLLLLKDLWKINQFHNSCCESQSCNWCHVAVLIFIFIFILKYSQRKYHLFKISRDRSLWHSTQTVSKKGEKRLLAFFWCGVTVKKWFKAIVATEYCTMFRLACVTLL